VTAAEPDTATELRLIRKDIAAIRRQVVKEQEAREQLTREREQAVLPLPVSPPRVLNPHPVPQRHYRVLGALRGRIHRRSHLGAMSHKRISGQRRLALWLTTFAVIRTVVWLAAMGLIVAHWLGVGGPFLHWFTSLSATVIFVTFISFYCNASTDAANMAAGFAALFSADSHAAVVSTGQLLQSDLEELQADVEHLAGLSPGPEATALSVAIKRKLASE
jgi:hypothetical protein